MLIETLVALAIFSFGILALVGMQALAMRHGADAKLRADASYLASQIISQMWVDRSNLADYIHKPTTTGVTSGCIFSGSTSSSASVTTWLGDSTQRDSVLGALPNAAAQILVETGTGLVTVTVCWRAPQEALIHNFTTSALISG